MQPFSPGGVCLWIGLTLDVYNGMERVASWLAWHCWVDTKPLSQRSPTMKSFTKTLIFVFLSCGRTVVSGSGPQGSSGLQGDLGLWDGGAFYGNNLPFLRVLSYVWLVLRARRFSLPNRSTLLRNVCLNVKTKT